MWNNKLTFRNAALKDKPDTRLYREQMQTSATLLWLAPCTEINTGSNPDLTPPVGQRVFKKGLTTGNTVTSNRLWIPAVTPTRLLSKQQQCPKRTADQQGKWITTWVGAISSSFIAEKFDYCHPWNPTVGNISSQIHMSCFWQFPAVMWIGINELLWVDIHNSCCVALWRRLFGLSAPQMHE